MMDKNPATDATLPKYKAEEREIWTAEMLMQAIDACDMGLCGYIRRSYFREQGICLY